MGPAAPGGKGLRPAGEGDAAPAAEPVGLIALLRREPNKYSYASTGAGGITHVLMELFRQRTRTEVEAVHYRGSAPAQQDLISGTVELGIDALSDYEQYAREGKVKILAVLSPQRSPLTPEVLTTSEAGVPDFVFVNWFTLMAPRSVPEDIVQRLVEANRTVLRDTSVGERLRAAGYTPAPGASAELSDLIAREFRVFGEVVRANNIRSE
jgi:tripartite-type tricarboxylate transporter receptor subunit TctC